MSERPRREAGPISGMMLRCQWKAAWPMAVELRVPMIWIQMMCDDVSGSTIAW